MDEQRNTLPILAVWFRSITFLINYFIAPSVTGIPGDGQMRFVQDLQSWEDLANSRIDFTEVFTEGERK